MYLRLFPLLMALTVLLPSVCAADQVYFYHTDPAGTPLAITDSSGAVAWKADYKPFGEENSITGSGSNDRGFIGKQKDTETGLSYFGARYQDAKTGRFISPDQVRAVDARSNKTNEKLLQNPQKLNVYAYGLNNPYKYIDPDGNEVKYKEAFMAMLGMGTNGFGLAVGFGLAGAPDPTFLTKAVSVAVVGKTSYGVTVNYQNLVNALSGQECPSSGGLGTDLAGLLAPGNKNAKAVGSISELALDLAAGGAGRSVSTSSLGMLSKYNMERVSVRNPTEIGGGLATGLQLGDLSNAVSGVYNDFKKK